jgi:flagellar motility protein MotE (MotC chaperone)
LVVPNSQSDNEKARSFLTKEERVALLKEYKDELEKETRGVEERIKELEDA